MAKYVDITGHVKFLNTKDGHGAVMPNVLVGAHNQLIFFTQENTEDWDRLKRGSIVMTDVKSENGKLYANNLSLLQIS
ncbi:hypothetical protein KC865_03615 [Candidatus Kaiserbacteria bacterium]|nr:hypothetical protein [Candidatus Kaiserbacteria bacterium]USN91944.1 MAG: hypothetical protein H6782_03655 [Candidatus Nomurabacteria bacterium]